MNARNAKPAAAISGNSGLKGGKPERSWVWCQTTNANS